jgi:flagellar biosynthesis activator protein FlaF
MTQSAQAYRNVANQISSPREMEADKLLFAASQLQAIRDAWDSKRSELNAALLNNRKLWSVLVISVTRPENPLPAALRQNVANLGIFVLKQTMAVQANPKPDQLASLISINRELASGLLGRA